MLWFAQRCCLVLRTSDVNYSYIEMSNIYNKKCTIDTIDGIDVNLVH